MSVSQLVRYLSSELAADRVVTHWLPGLPAQSRRLAKTDQICC